MPINLNTVRELKDQLEHSGYIVLKRKIPTKKTLIRCCPNFSRKFPEKLIDHDETRLQSFWITILTLRQCQNDEREAGKTSSMTLTSEGARSRCAGTMRHTRRRGGARAEGW